MEYRQLLQLASAIRTQGHKVLSVGLKADRVKHNIIEVLAGNPDIPAGLPRDHADLAKALLANPDVVITFAGRHKAKQAPTKTAPTKTTPTKTAPTNQVAVEIARIRSAMLKFLDGFESALSNVLDNAANLQIDQAGKDNRLALAHLRKAEELLKR